MDLSAKELTPSQKLMLEEILGRELLSSEMVSVRAYQVEISSLEEREAARKKLLAYLESVPAPKGTEEALEAAILQAMREVRPGYTEVR
jgi:hypothetical protein